MESHAVVVSLATIPKVTASLSMIGSFLILQEVVRSSIRRKQPYQRLLAGLSLADLISSIVLFCGTWPMPRETQSAYGAMGTQTTCDIAGFFLTWTNPIAPLYNAALALYYVAAIRYRWDERRIAQVERVFHVVVWLMGLGFAITALQLKLYNNVGNLVCWMGHLPRGCRDSFLYGKEAANCKRGDNAFIFQWAFYTCFGWLSFLIMVSCLTSVYLTVLKIEKQRDSYHFYAQQTEGDRKKSRRVFEQGVLYGGAFVLSWIFQTTSTILYVTTGKFSGGILILAVIFLPLQGFWNAVIYRRERSSSVFSTLLQYLVCVGCYFIVGQRGSNEENSGNNRARNIQQYDHPSVSGEHTTEHSKSCLEDGNVPEDQSCLEDGNVPENKSCLEDDNVPEKKC